MKTDEELERDVQRAERAEQHELRKIGGDVEDAATRKRDVAANIQAAIDNTRDALFVAAEITASMGLEVPAAALMILSIEVGVASELQKRGLLFPLAPTAEEEAKKQRVIHYQAKDKDSVEHARGSGVSIRKLDDVRTIPPADRKKLSSDARALANHLKSPASHVGAHAVRLHDEAARWHAHHNRLHVLMMHRIPNFVTAFTPVADPASIKRRAEAIAVHDRALLFRELRIHRE